MKECGLFIKLMSDKSYIFKVESAIGEKLSKDSLTVLVAAFSDGSEKLPTVVVGKSPKPPCFKNVGYRTCHV